MVNKYFENELLNFEPAPGIGEHYKKIVMDVFQSEQTTGSDERKMIADQINGRKRFYPMPVDAL